MKLWILLLLYMIFRALYQRQHISLRRLVLMATRQSNGACRPYMNGANKDDQNGVTLKDLPKSNVFTSQLPPDPEFPTPQISFKAAREDLGPRIVKGALYTYVRPEGIENPELLAVSHGAMNDIGLIDGEEKTQNFKDLVAGNKILWDPDTMKGIYPWAQCYGGINSILRLLIRRVLIHCSGWQLYAQDY